MGMDGQNNRDKTRKIPYFQVFRGEYFQNCFWHIRILPFTYLWLITALLKSQNVVKNINTLLFNNFQIVSSTLYLPSSLF